jgi:hypothetical protein
MLRFNEDILFLIFGELVYDKKSLYSCLLVNRTWCATAVQILWKSPGIFGLSEGLSEGATNKLINVIL